jgi:hypothetical protein
VGGGASANGAFDVEPQAQSVNARTIKMRVRIRVDLFIDKAEFFYRIYKIGQDGNGSPPDGCPASFVIVPRQFGCRP